MGIFVDYDADPVEFIEYLSKECLYLKPKLIPGNRYACVYPLMFTHAIIVGAIGDRLFIQNRWCYEDEKSAIEALDAWDGTGEPNGWHRHPMSGRRRPEGDRDREYINP